MSNAQKKLKRMKEKGQVITYPEFKKVECTTSLDEYYDNLITSEQVSCSVAEYGRIIDSVNDDFEASTRLNKVDVSILFLGIALQVARQYLISNEKFRMSNSQNENVVKKPLKKLGFERIIEPVPYDATHYVGGKSVFKEKTGISTHGLSGTNHRSLALGHDPFLGWIFGPMNILTETVTKNNPLLESYTTQMSMGGYKVDNLTNISVIVKDSTASISEHPTNLLISVATHAVHLSTDAFTKLGLPLPVINNISPDFAQMLQKNGIDVYSVSRGATLSVLINKLISCIHTLFYDEGIDIRLYQIKTRKILMLSNAIASSSNLIYSAITGDLKKLDVGGLCVTLYRLFADPRFINSVKYEYLNSEVSKIYQAKFDRLREDTYIDFSSMGL